MKTGSQKSEGRRQKTKDGQYLTSVFCFPTSEVGFTLIEMAVVLIVIGLLILTVFPALTALRANSQRALTQSNLNTLMLATAAYVQANGCLPCPTPAITIGAGFGRVGGNTAGAACLTCTTPKGIPPFASLGIAASMAHDGWGRWITMRIDPALTAVALGSTVPPASPCTAADVTANVPSCLINGASQQGFSKKGLCQVGLSTANRVNVATPGGGAQQAAVIFVSHGSRGYGAFVADALLYSNGINGNRLPFPAGSPSCPANPASANNGPTFAVCNADGQNQFVNAAMQDGYDDMLAYADRNTLVGMPGNGACQTVW